MQCESDPNTSNHSYTIYTLQKKTHLYKAQLYENTIAFQ